MIETETMMRRILLSVFLVLTAIATAIAGMYIWTDDKGVKHYSNMPPPSGTQSVKRPEIAYREPPERTKQQKFEQILKATVADEGTGGEAEIQHKIYPKQEFIDLVQGKTPEAVYKFLKRTPDRRDERKTWVYYDIVNDPIENRIESVAIHFKRQMGKSTADELVFFVNKKPEAS